MNIIKDLNSGCEGFIDWNLCLDEKGGPNHTDNLCVAPMICDTTWGVLKPQPSLYYIGHFSKWIRPGAKRVLCAASRDALEVTAFANIDDSIAVVVMNQSSNSFNFWLKVAGNDAELPRGLYV